MKHVVINREDLCLALAEELSLKALQLRLFGEESKDAATLLYKYVHKHGLQEELRVIRERKLKDGSVLYNKISPEDLLVKSPEGTEVKRSTLRRVIIENNLLPYECACCGQDEEWRGYVMSLDLDHIDGDPTNNLLENLRFLCGCCHKITSTYCGRNIKFSRSSYACQKCGSKVSLSRVKLCRTCSSVQAAAPRRRFEITKEELEALLPSHSYETIAKMYGVGVTALRKRALRIGSPLPPRRGDPMLNRKRK